MPMTLTTAVRVNRCAWSARSRAGRTTPRCVEDLTTERDDEYPGFVRIVRRLRDTDGRQELGATLRSIYTGTGWANEERRLYDGPGRCWYFCLILRNEGKWYRGVYGTRRWIFKEVAHNLWNK